jgi:ketosteroid isomerase-like protein
LPKFPYTAQLIIDLINWSNPMSKFSLCLIVMMTCFSTHSFADIKSDVKKVALDWERALAKYDVKALASLLTANVTIADDVAPFLWEGEGAPAKYINDFKAAMSKDKLSNMVVDVKDAVTVLENKNEVYAVFPVSVSYKNADNKTIYEEAYKTIILSKSKNGKWLIKHITWTSVKGFS